MLRYLCERGLALRGDNENVGNQQNGNFLATLEYLSKFDPFIAKHLNEKSNKGGEVHERFICFEPAVGHSGKNIAQAILKKLEEFDLNILDARGQSYDNASNMSGKFEGVQAHLKKSNKYMDFIPCTAHSLNLVGNNALENCSASTYRWETVCGDLKSIDGRTVALKSLSETRWSARAHSTKVLCENYDTILSRLKYLSENMEVNKDTRNEAQNIIKKMTSLDIAFMTVLWNRVLERFD
ncbi:zinc finger MYM-type protein 1-like [Myzus persicae]|uniref:zinc finger MYM-type protein 1-like n=1 Tax=Myzus persicae TaxID=13164 RepID=UPI000B934FBB|nr:zinc finger MYM-type protein 1-like [Myzus persicae]